MAYLYLKAFHIVFAVTWFAGLFYLPRLFVYHALADDDASVRRFITMERRLFIIMTIGAVLTVALGLWLLVGFNLWVFGTRTLWLHLKLAAVAALIGYHLWCYLLMQDLAAGRDTHSDRWFRWFNEFPAVLLIAIVVLAVVKPF